MHAIARGTPGSSLTTALLFDLPDAMLNPAPGVIEGAAFVMHLKLRDKKGMLTYYLPLLNE